MQGIVFTQNGVPIRRSADYQRVIDSRWRFLEVEKELETTVEIPAIASSGDTTVGYEQKILLLRHNLGFYPLFEASVTLESGSPPFSQNYTTVYADQEAIYLFPSYSNSDGQTALTLTVRVRVFNMRLDEEYEAMKEATFGTAPTTEPEFGIKFIDGTGQSRLEDDSPVGFSIDTSKKIMSIHMIKEFTFDTSLVWNSMEHNVGYPPSYLVARWPYQPFAAYASGYSIPHRNDYFSGKIEEPDWRIRATATDIEFSGVQATPSGTYGVIILKDPVDLAV